MKEFGSRLATHCETNKVRGIAQGLRDRMLEKHWARRPKYEVAPPLMNVVEEVLDELGKKAQEFRDDILRFFAEHKDIDSDALLTMNRKVFGQLVVDHCGKRAVMGVSLKLRKSLVNFMLCHRLNVHHIRYVFRKPNEQCISEKEFYQELYATRGRARCRS